MAEAASANTPPGTPEIKKRDMLTLLTGSTVAIGVAQKGQAVAALRRRGALGLDEAGDNVFRPQRRRAAAAAFGDQDVAIWQDEGLSRDSESSGDRGDNITAGRDGPPFAPSGRVGDLLDRLAGNIRHQRADVLRDLKSHGPN